MGKTMKGVWMCFAAAALGMAISSQAQAGALATAAGAYNNGLGPDGGAWRGSTSFSSGTLAGYIDWAVFGPGAFPYPGYSPTSGELTYAYQIFVTGTAPVSTFSMPLIDQADTIGAFTNLAGAAPSSMFLNPNSSATWQFSGIPQSSNSEGLAFSSSRIPLEFQGTVIDTGQSASPVPLPTPSGVPIPEPGSLMVAGLMAGLLARRRVG